MHACEWVDGAIQAKPIRIPAITPTRSSPMPFPSPGTDTHFRYNVISRWWPISGAKALSAH
jgi:hypothetical protein